jgi:mannose-1-phosphate guanylyltransferase
LEEVLPRDPDGNWTQADLLSIDSSRNIVVSEVAQHKIVCLGIEDLIVVHTPDATLVCKKSEAERIKQAVEALRRR